MKLRGIPDIRLAVACLIPFAIRHNTLVLLVCSEIILVLSKKVINYNSDQTLCDPDTDEATGQVDERLADLGYIK